MTDVEHRENVFHCVSSCLAITGREARAEEETCVSNKFGGKGNLSVTLEVQAHVAEKCDVLTGLLL